MTTYAQSGRVLFAGRIVDEETSQPVSYATVRLLALPDSSFLAGVSTGDDGRFKLTVMRKKVQPIALLKVLCLKNW